MATRTDPFEGRDPSYPDRARIESDVRALLKPASSPWIVFDRDSHVDQLASSAMRAGVAFVSSPSYRPEVLKAAEEMNRPLDEIALLRRSQLPTPIVIADTEGRFFPPPTAAEPSVVEPSTVSLASDVFVEPAEEAPKAPRRGKRAFVVAAVAAALGVALFTGARHRHATPVAAHGAPVVVAVAAAAPAPQPPAPTALAAPEAPAAVAAPAPAAAPSSDTTPTKKRLGKLTLKGDASRKTVWFDGKRMLGTGQRTFTVLCGMHTVAVNEKTESKDIEVPCSGEYVVGK